MKTAIRVKNYILRQLNLFISINKAKRLGITFHLPNYIYLNKLNSNSTVVDVGCANDPDFSIHVINKYNCKCYGVDPTKKHFDALKKIESDYKNKFFHLPFAVANKSGKLIFHESKTNVSGSIMDNHTNIKQDKITSYEVNTINLKELKQMVACNGVIDFLKLDLEGAEYDLLENIESSDLDNINQLFIEFHHHCIDSYTLNDTNRLVQKIKNLGFNTFTVDQHNFLFYK